MAESSYFPNTDMFLTEVKGAEKKKETPLKEETLLQKKFNNENSNNMSSSLAQGNKNTQKNMSNTTSQKFGTSQQRKSLLPSINQKSRASTSAIAKRPDKKFENIKSLISECKSAKKLPEKSGKNPLVTFYENKIVQNFDTIYKSGNPNKIMKELKRIEKRKFLEQELLGKQAEMEKDKAKLNSIQNEIRKKQLIIKGMEANAEAIQLTINQESQEQTIEEYTQEETDLQNELESMKFTIESLSYVHASRKKLVLQIKKMCSERTSNLKFVETRTNFFSNLTEKRKKKCEEYSKKLSRYSSYLTPDLLGPRFSEMLEDELSVFEETRAVKEIFKHENEIEVEKEKKAASERKAAIQKQNVLKEKANDRIRREKRKEEEVLKDLKTSFSKIRKVTNVRAITELPEHKLNLELGQKFFEELLLTLGNEIEAKKEENLELHHKLHALLNETVNDNSNEEENKMEEIEKMILIKHNIVTDLENSNSKLKKLISDVCVATARILYQMQKDKTHDKEVKISNVVSSLSSMGLKLERLLNILSSFKTALNVESLNTDGTIENNMKNDIKKSLGLNSRIFLNMDPEMYEENRDDLFVNREDDPAEYENTEYLAKKRNKTKFGQTSKAKVKETNEKINLKGIL